MQGKVFLVTGGTRSGKSLFAEQLAASCSFPVTYIATAVVTDAEMQERVNLHQERRPSDWETYEEPYRVSDLIRAIGFKGKVLLLDCLTVYIGNLLWQNSLKNDGEKREIILNEVKEIIKTAKHSGATVVIVSSEVGLGLVPDNQLGRFYRDLLGEANQEVAKTADEVYFVASGIPLALKSLSKTTQLGERN